MQLPFTADQFFAVFAAYNTRVWPVAVLLWLATVWAAVAFARGRAGRRPLLGLLAAHWAWAGLAYHVAFFSAINPAAFLFGGLFVVEALLLAASGRHGDGVLTPARGWRGGAALALVTYALAYPALAMAGGHGYPAVPTFGVPCPTTILTAGVLIGAGGRLPRTLTVVPILWAGVGGSAAFLLGVWPDLALPVAGAAMLAAATSR